MRSMSGRLPSSSFVVLLQGLMVLALAGCQPPSPQMKFIKQADRLHNESLASTMIVDADLDEYLQRVADRVAGAAKVTSAGKVNVAFIASVRCHLVNSNTINAFSTGGRHIYVTNGLFQQCENEEDLAAAIAHAYAHLINLDLEATKMEPDAGTPLPMVAWQYVINRYTREQERRADALGLSLYTKGGWDPSHFATLYQRVEGISGGNVSADRESLPGRVASMEDEAANVKLPPRQTPKFGIGDLVADPETFASLRQKAATFHEPKIINVPQIFLRAFPNCVLSGDTPEQKDAQQRLKPVPPPPPKLDAS